MKDRCCGPFMHMETPVPPHEVIIVPAVGQEGREQLRQQCYDVRFAVFHYEQGFPYETELDEFDETATHILLRLVPSMKPIGTIRCVKRRDYYKLSRLAVLSDFRKFKLGRKLVLALHDWVKQDAKASGIAGITRIHLHSQIPVKGFYAKYDYEPEGEEFDEDGAPHQLMVYKFQSD